MSDPAAVVRMFDAAETAFGGVDVLVNNASVMALSSIAGSDDALLDRHIAINLKGNFNGMREAARRLRNGGRIINFPSRVGALRLETYGVYAATKAAAEAMPAVLSKELRGRSITVNAVAPGPPARLPRSRGIASIEKEGCAFTIADAQRLDDYGVDYVVLSAAQLRALETKRVRTGHRCDPLPWLAERL